LILPVGDHKKEVVNRDDAIAIEVCRAVTAGFSPKTDDVQDVIDGNHAIGIGIARDTDIIAIETIDADGIDPSFDD
jgi:hypothetical protein